jgi:hypothetical protein
VVAGGIFPKDEVEQQQLMYFKNKVFIITDTGWRLPQCIDIAYLPTTQAWRPLASAPPECGSFRPVSRFSPIPVCPGSFCPHWPPQCIDIAPKKMMVWQKELIVLALQGMKFMHVDIFSTLLKRTTLYYRSYIVYTCIVIVSSWQNFLMTKSNNNNLCISRTKCSSSQTLDDDPHNV